LKDLCSLSRLLFLIVFKEYCSKSQPTVFRSSKPASPLPVIRESLYKTVTSNTSGNNSENNSGNNSDNSSSNNSVNGSIACYSSGNISGNITSNDTNNFTGSNTSNTLFSSLPGRRTVGLPSESSFLWLAGSSETSQAIPKERGPLIEELD
jgi:hypothetical protein